ncbi:hypothetical protein N7465_001534 [Penicillium sp. CMV-2018d]|nr:hypothetical protein N7465_001534 [Penicillium sp. CMV-2018d]
MPRYGGIRQYWWSPNMEVGSKPSIASSGSSRSLTLIVWFGVSLENETPCVSGRELPTNLACRPE